MSEYDYLELEPFFDSWKIERKIGKGANGTVYLISKKEVGWTFYAAMKVISVPESEDETRSILAERMTSEDMISYYKSMVDDVVKEIITMSKLKGNTNVVSYEDHMVVPHKEGFGWDIFIKMEYLTPLVDILPDKVLDEAQIIKIGIDICKALELCSEIRIIHRDIKPENIYIAPSGDYKLGDFGVAKTIDRTVVGLSRKGTIEYMAPEVFLKGKCNLTADIYSLGMVMYKLMNNNRTPFLPEYPKQIMYADREAAVIKRFKGEKINAPQNGDEGLKSVVMKACEFDPKNRYQSPTNMRLDLEALQKELGYQTADALDSARKTASGFANVDMQSVKPRRSAKKRKRPLAIALILIAMFLAGFGYYMSMPKEITDIRGVDSGTEILLGESISPEYEAFPRRFAKEPVSFEVSGDCIKVDENGKIQAVRVGDSHITLSAGGYKETILITVKPIVTSIENVKEKISLLEGKSKTLKPVLQPKKYENEKIEFSVEDESVARISSKGKITGKKAGSTVVYITAGGCIKAVKITVKAPKPDPEPVQEETVSDIPVYEPSQAPVAENKNPAAETQKPADNDKKNTSTSSKNKSSSDDKNDQMGSFGDDEYFEEE